MNALGSVQRGRARARSLVEDRVILALCIVFVLAALFYLWTAGTTSPLALDGADGDPYNRLADAFLHRHLSVGYAPAELLRLPDPYDPVQNAPFRAAYGIHDLALYDGRLYETWGPAPVLVLLVPLRLLGFAPSSSLTTAMFAIAGLGFALATLRVVLRQIGGVPVWMCVLAALALACSTAVPFILRRPAVYEEAIAAGYCFAAAGIWLVASTLVDRAASVWRLALMSLSFGLAAGSRPVLGALALALVPVYRCLRGAVPPRRLLAALLGPIGLCGAALLAYNAARFGHPLEVGQSYVLAGYNPRTVRYADPGYVAPGLWFYLLSPPRPTTLFPFIVLTPPPISYPGGVPAGYTGLEITGGLLPMTPILLLIAALPWIWRQRSAPLGPLPLALVVLIVAGVAGLLFLSFEFFGTTQRYEVDFAPLFLIAAIAAWLALSDAARGARRRLVRVGGAILIVWGCITGLAISFTGYYNGLAASHPGTWHFLEDLGSPVSTAIAIVAGRPVLADVSSPNLVQVSAVRYTSLGAGVTGFSLGAADQATLTIVSPDSRRAALVVTAMRGPAIGRHASLEVVLRGPGRESHAYAIRAARTDVPLRLPVQLGRGLNRIVLSPLASASKQPGPAAVVAQPLLVVPQLALSAHG